MEIKKSMVYTRTGDKGMTSLVGGERVSKYDDRLEAYGTVDELSSTIGLLITYLQDKKDNLFLTRIQHLLFNLGGHLATDTSTTDLTVMTVIPKEEIVRIEKEIDRLDALLPKMNSFLLPGGARGACVAHQARTICRRAERRILFFYKEIEAQNELKQRNIDPNIPTFINRLSDYLFILSRKINKDEGFEEKKWENVCESKF